MKQNRKRSERRPVERLCPTPETGLTEEQAAQRRAAGWNNAAQDSLSKTEWQIVRDNVIYLFQFCVRGAGRLPVRCWRIPRHDVFGHCGRQCVHRHCAGAARQTHAGQGDTALGQHGLCGPRRPNAHRPHRRAGTGRHCAAAPGQPGVRGRRCCGRDAGGKRSAADRRGRACAKNAPGTRCSRAVLW